IFECPIFLEHLSPLAAFMAKYIPLTENTWYEVITTGIAQVVLIAKTVDARVGLASRVSPLVKKARDIDSDYKISQTLLEKAQQFGLASLGGGIYQRVANMGLPGEQTVESLISSVISTAAEKIETQQAAIAV
ncbi:MAG: hypothetical protein SGCHY_005613, partial [Lobulomycetales sp.]